MSATTCRVCHRALKNPKAIEAGIGPVCAAKQGRVVEANEGVGTLLLHDPDPNVTLVFRRVQTGRDLFGGAPETAPAMNFPQVHVLHSPTGMEFGYGGSGPADAALNALLALGYNIDTATKHHQAVKWKFIAGLPDAGGDIEAAAVRAFVASQEVARA